MSKKRKLNNETKESCSLQEENMRLREQMQQLRRSYRRVVRENNTLRTNRNIITPIVINDFRQALWEISNQADNITHNFHAYNQYQHDVLFSATVALMEWDNARITEELETYLRHPLSDIFSVAVNICHNSR